MAETSMPPWKTSCCNPFEDKKHKKTKYLRPVLEWMITLKPYLSLDSLICDKCRKNLLLLKKQSNTLVNNENINDASLPDNVGKDNEYVLLSNDSDNQDMSEPDNAESAEFHRLVHDVSLDALNRTLQTMGESPIRKKKLTEKKYPEKKLKKVNIAINKTVINYASNETDSFDGCVSPDDEILSQLKKKFNSSDSKSEQLQILTVLPISWSIRKVQKEFGVTYTFARKAKQLVKESGILSSPNPKPGKTLNCETSDLVKTFYNCDEIGRIMPGKKDFVSMKVNGTKRHVQKRLLLNNLKEIYVNFKEAYPENQIGFSKFAELRPDNCILAGAKGTHCVCVCVIHQNVKLMFTGCKIKELTKTEESENIITSYKDFLAQLMCHPPKASCYLGDCLACPNLINLKSTLEDLFEKHGIEYITYKQWVSTDRSTLETLTKSADDFIEVLLEKMVKLRSHSFIAKKQADVFETLKSSVKDNEYVVVCDFAENYSFILQDEAQGFHWNNSQATLHPFVIYYNEDNITKHLSLVIISDYLIHDTVAVHVFQRYMIKFIIDTLGRKPEKFYYFSDGSAAQYKNRKNFVNLCEHKNDFQINAEWHFFATSHGKNACDGIGGTVKRLAARTSLQRPYDDQIMTPRQLFDWASCNIKGIKFRYVTSEEHVNEEKKLSARFNCSRTIPGTQKLHSFVPLSDTLVRTRIYSEAVTFKDQLITSSTNDLDIKEIRGFVTCMYDVHWWLGCVLNTYEDSDEVKINFLHPFGPSPSYVYPAKSDILTVVKSQILMKVDPLTATGCTYTLSEKEVLLTIEKFNIKIVK